MLHKETNLKCYKMKMKSKKLQLKLYIDIIRKSTYFCYTYSYKNYMISLKV